MSEQNCTRIETRTRIEKATRIVGKDGRPATGRSTRVINASIPIWLDALAKKAAFDDGETYSGLITSALQSALLQLQSSQ